jgi:succinate dehydrogenase/fumarate reductase flavoprotein subunit
MPHIWDVEADVVVVGFGAAGMAASVTAHDLGAKVVILEKAPEGQEGGNTRVAG